MSNSAFLSANGYLGLIAEVTRGTNPGSGTPFFWPVMQPSVTPQLTWLNDPGLRGSPVENYDQVPATRHDEVDFKCNVYADTFPILLCATLGSADTKSGSGPYTHSIGLENDAATGSQPNSYTICLFDAANWITTTGCQVDTLELAFGASTALEATLKFKGWPYTTATSAPAPFTSPSFSAEHLIPSWDCAVSVASGTYTWIEDGTLTIARKTEPIFTLGQQRPDPIFTGPIEVTGKFTAIVHSNADSWSAGATPTALNLNQEVMTITFTDPNDTHSATSDSIEFQMSATQFRAPKRTMTKSFVEVEVEFTAVANTTDAISGYSPITTVTTNGISTAYQ